MGDNLRKRIIAGCQWFWGNPILIGACIALFWANISPGTYHSVLDFAVGNGWLHLTIHDFVNEVLMCFFFVVVAKEVREAFLPEGPLHGWNRAALPLAATAGGVLVPAVMYVALSSVWAPHAVGGWVIPTATDIVFALTVASVIYGTHKHAAVTFLITIAILDDLIGLMLIPSVYADGVAWGWFGIGLILAVGAPFLLRGLGVRRYWVYLLVVGVPVWVIFMVSHVEPALALVPLVIGMPHANNDLGYFRSAELQRHDALNEMEHALVPLKGPILFAFGLANAGVPVGGIGSLTGIVLVALLLGKVLGIATFTLTAMQCRMQLPKGMRFGDVLVTAVAGGIGFTVSLFVADVALAGEARNAAGMGALLSLPVGALVAWGTARWLRVGRFSESKRVTDPT